MNRRKYWDYHRITDGIEEKQCKNCLKWFEMTLTNFSTNKGNKDGYHELCKTCQKEYNDNYYLKTKDRQISKAKTRYYNNPEVNKKNVEWCIYKYHNDPIRNSKNKAAAKRQAERGDQDRWRKENPDKLKHYNKNHRNHDITNAEKCSLLKVFNHKCAYCGMTEEENKLKHGEKLHHDHVDHEGYNDLRNDVPACTSCNTSKHTASMGEWYKQQKFFNEEKLQFIYWWISEGYKDYIEDKSPYRIIRKKNEDNRTYHHELWSVDEKRNIIECIAKKPKKKDLNEDIEKYMRIN